MVGWRIAQDLDSGRGIAAGRFRPPDQLGDQLDDLLAGHQPQMLQLLEPALGRIECWLGIRLAPLEETEGSRSSP
jgi:hypothetical protein